MSAFGQNLKKLRTDKGLTLQRVGAVTGADPDKAKKLAWAWENGKGTPNLETISALAELLGTSVEYLVTGQDRWPFDAALLAQVQALDAPARAQCEGALRLVLAQIAPPRAEQKAA